MTLYISITQFVIFSPRFKVLLKNLFLQEKSKG